ncbi:ClC family H(+)/Cl(-) exchange transporter [Anaerorhabdus sp.]|uniref:ClC family H(+)/Cl(-) exchange transporter n=1 Tax=Anaerorhabdus sp. TaxID=1872524 RepID=UPI002B20BEFE|nr:ClC family H(+)/Cl(-) exchange transporter [Anaerorhabdus sp.]MEA4873817.1 ClC family H(+)/Cl(-) exchange transporter [Anaerorhabdus sp.]
MSETKISKLFTELNQLKWSVVSKGVIVGLFAGFVVALYRLGIEFATEKSIEIYEFLKHNQEYIIVWIVVIVVVGLLIAWLIKCSPESKGSGIPQVEGVVLMGMKMRSFFIIPVRFIAGILSAFFGVSLGREGPSIQIGACGGDIIASKLSHNKLEENYLITAGASAGLAAAFNAPLSGIIFALEEIHRSFSPNILLAATTAALTADVVSKTIFGLKPVLSYVDIPALPLSQYGWLLLLGILTGVVGALVNKFLLVSSKVYDVLPAWSRPMVALLLALPFGLFLPQVLGGGQNLVQLSETAQMTVGVLFVVFIAKLFFTTSSFGSGIPGGIFMPILSMGAIVGSIFAQTLSGFGIPASSIAILCICSMAGVMAGSVKAPITSILLMAEMTGSLVHLLPVAAVAFIALLTSDLLGIHPIYEVLLERLVDKDHVNKKHDNIVLEIVVEMGSDVAGKKVSEVNWPTGTLIAGIRRGQKEYVPNGDFIIYHGDYLIVLSSEHELETMNTCLNKLCRKN